MKNVFLTWIFFYVCQFYHLFFSFKKINNFQEGTFDKFPRLLIIKYNFEKDVLL